MCADRKMTEKPFEAGTVHDCRSPDGLPSERLAAAGGALTAQPASADDFLLRAVVPLSVRASAA